VGGPELKRLAFAFVLLIALAPGAASAHQLDPSLRIVLDTVTPQLPGDVVIQARVSVAEQLLVANPTTTVLEVEADTGEPFLRVSSAGVFANEHSNFWYASLAPFGLAQNVVSPGEQPDWVQVSTTDAWGWFDHRLHPSALSISPAVRSAGKRVVVSNWTVKMRYGDEFADVAGHVEFDPILGAITPRLTSPANPAPGLQAVVLPGPVPGVFLSNTSTSTVTVFGASGEPFLRLGPSGAEVNTLSPTWVDNLVVQDLTPTKADASALPQWTKVADVPRFGWIDYRLAYADSRPPESVALAGRTVTLVTWSIPVLTASGSLSLDGVTEWQPNGSGLPAIGAQSRIAPVISLALLAIAAGAYVAFRRFRRKPI
jgi:hypothetical protein